MTVIEKIAQFTTNLKYEEIPVEVINTAKMALTDFVAVTVAGNDMPVCQDVRKYIKQYLGRDGECVIFGRRKKLDLASAALFNGVSSHAMDFDDLSSTCMGHPTIGVAPTCFASAQEKAWNGKDLLKAYISSVEGMHQIARLTIPALSERGWHTTLVYGVFGATIAAALNYKVDAGTLCNALAIAASRSSGLRANFGSKTKALHAGLSNLVGIECVRLAMAGITGKADAIEGQDGFSRCFIGKDVAGEVNIGKFWDLKETGIGLKRYPCCSGTHPANDVLDEYLKQHPIDPNDIDHIDAGVSLLGPRELTCHQPQDAVEAKFSMEFALAYRLLKGPIKIASFKDEVVNDPELQNFMKKVNMEISPELAKLGFIGSAPVRLQIFLKNGEVIKLANDLALGKPKKPFTEQILRDKFMDCVAPVCGSRKAENWYDVLRNLEKAKVSDLKELGRKS